MKADLSRRDGPTSTELFREGSIREEESELWPGWLDFFRLVITRVTKNNVDRKERCDLEILWISWYNIKQTELLKK
jgi:hypothetical protein